MYIIIKPNHIENYSIGIEFAYYKYNCTINNKLLVIIYICLFSLSVDILRLACTGYNIIFRLIDTSYYTKHNLSISTTSILLSVLLLSTITIIVYAFIII